MEYNEKLKKIEALFEGAKTQGEREAAELAKRRILDRFREEFSSRAIEYTVRLGDRWHKRLFVALCNKYELRTYRYKNQKYTTTISLNEFISTITDDLISKIHEVEEDTIVSGQSLPA